MGLRQGDRVQSVNGQPIEAIDQFISIIRGMNAGDQVEIGIVRDQTENKLRGKLEAFGQALARGTDPNSGSERRIGRSLLSNRFGDNMANPNVQTSYEERNSSGRQLSGDVEQRLMNLEQQLSQLRQDMSELRTTIGNKSTNESSGSTAPAVGASGSAGAQAPSDLRPTPPSAR